MKSRGNYRGERRIVPIVTSSGDTHRATVVVVGKREGEDTVSEGDFRGSESGELISHASSATFDLTGVAAAENNSASYKEARTRA